MTQERDPQRRIAVLKPCCIGDCITALPAVDALASEFGTATIDVFVGKHSRAAFGFRQGLNTRMVPDSPDLASAMQLSRVLRQGHYDTVICLDRSRWLKLAVRLSRANVTAQARSMSPEHRHESEVYLDVVREIGVPTPTGTPLIIPAPCAEREAADLLAGIPQPIAIIHPGGAQNPGVNMLDKRWPSDRFVELARTLQGDGTTVLISGGPGDVDTARNAAHQAGLPDSSILAGWIDIPTLAAVLSRATVYVGPDTGASHIAAAVGVPTVAIFGPTNPRRYRPLGPHVQVLAPPQSWQIPDRDLRRTGTHSPKISTESISLEAVLSATRESLRLRRGLNPCA